jgi:hypothetical protein
MSGYQRCCLHVIGYDIVVQACAETWAHLLVCETKWRGKSAGYHVSLPDLACEFKRTHHNELPSADFDRVLAEHRQAILDLIAQLNTSD